MMMILYRYEEENLSFFDEHWGAYNVMGDGL